MSFARKVMIATVSLAFANAGVATAQERTVRTQVLLSALAYVAQTHATEKSIAVSSMLQPNSHDLAATNHDAEFVRQANAMARIRVVKASDVFRCTSTLPSSCSLTGADLLASLAEPAILTNEATVAVEYRAASPSRRQPTYSRRVRLNLRFSNGHWTVVSETLLSMS